MKEYCSESVSSSYSSVAVHEIFAMLTEPAGVFFHHFDITNKAKPILFCDVRTLFLCDQARATCNVYSGQHMCYQNPQYVDDSSFVGKRLTNQSR